MNENPYETLKPPLASLRNEPKWYVPAHWLLSLIQIGQAAIQCVALAIYGSRISSHMPTMAEPEKSNWIQWQFDTFVIAVPFLSQFLLLPLLILLSLNRTYSARMKIAFFLAAICLSIFTWYNSIVAAAYTIETFD